MPDGGTGGVVEAIGRHPSLMWGRGAGEPGDGGAGEPEVDRDVLLALYRATNGREWTNEVEGDTILGHIPPPSTHGMA